MSLKLPPLSEVIERHGLRARKSLGQNFLLDLNLTRKIARQAEPYTDRTVIEVGPGPGGLTRALLETDLKKLIVIEKDDRTLPALEEIRALDPRLEIIHGDALEITATTLAAPPVKIIANLPYNIGTVLLLQWLERASHFESITVMLQKEVVDRLKAKPNTKDYGRLSVMTQWLCDAQAMFDVPRQAFVPPPKVTSTVVQLRPYAAPLFPADFKVMEKVVKAAFGQRRKMLRQSLKSLTADATTLLAAAGIDETRRAESLSVEEFCKLANAFKAS